MRIGVDVIYFKRMEGLREESGSLTVVLGLRMQAVMEEQGLQGVDVPISWEEDLAVAAAVAW